MHIRELKNWEHSTRFGIWVEHKLFTKYKFYPSVDGSGISANFKSGGIYNVHFSNKADFNDMLISTNIYHTFDELDHQIFSILRLLSFSISFKDFQNVWRLKCRSADLVNFKGI